MREGEELAPELSMGLQDAEAKPVRWSSSKGMALWGNVHQPASSPLSFTTGRRTSPRGRGDSSGSFARSSSAGVQVQRASSAGSQRRVSDGDFDGSFSMLPDSREGEDATKSFLLLDDENLSSSMKRSLFLLNMMPYRGPNNRLAGGVSGSSPATPLVAAPITRAGSAPKVNFASTQLTKPLHATNQHSPCKD